RFRGDDAVGGVTHGPATTTKNRAPAFTYRGSGRFGGPTPASLGRLSRGSNQVPVSTDFVMSIPPEVVAKSRGERCRGCPDRLGPVGDKGDRYGRNRGCRT